VSDGCKYSLLLEELTKLPQIFDLSGHFVAREKEREGKEKERNDGKTGEKRPRNKFLVTALLVRLLPDV